MVAALRLRVAASRARKRARRLRGVGLEDRARCCEVVVEAFEEWLAGVYDDGCFGRSGASRGDVDGSDWLAGEAGPSPGCAGEGPPFQVGGVA